MTQFELLEKEKEAQEKEFLEETKNEFNLSEEIMIYVKYAYRMAELKTESKYQKKINELEKQERNYQKKIYELNNRIYEILIKL